MQARDSTTGHGVTAAGAAGGLGNKGVLPVAAPAIPRRGPAEGVRPAGECCLERVADFAVVRLSADGWEDLTPRQRRLAWHLSRAALAGRDIYWDQVHPRGLAVRRLMEAIYRHQASLPPTFRARLTTYVKLLWLNNGFYNTRTRRKFVPAFTPADLRRGAAAALAAGTSLQELGVSPGLPLTAHLDALERAIFDAGFEPVLTLKSPGPGADLLAGSAVNFYEEGVTLDEVEAWAAAGGERHPLNARVVRRDGRIAEEVWRTGDPGTGIPEGRYAASIRTIVCHLQSALECADGAQAAALRRLISFYRTGSADDWQAFGIAWVQDRGSPVDTVNGFIEVYNDPRSQKGSFEGLVYTVDRPTTAIMDDLAASARYFEERAPWDDAFKRHDFTLPVAASVNLVMAVGNGGPVCAVGANLPNEQSIRERCGSKSLLLTNVLRAYDAAVSKAALVEFALPEERDAAQRHAAQARFLLTAMHEVLGHASGAVSSDLVGSPADHLKQHYNVLEEARAELVALHHLWDPKLAEIGALASEEVARAACQAYARSALVMLRRLKSGTTMEDDHMRATALIVNFLIDAGAVEVTRVTGRVFHRVTSFARMREGVATLLSDLQRIKATGDFAAAADLVQRYATEIDPRIRDEVVHRAAEAGLPDFHAVVLPRLEPVRDHEGRVVDVEARNDETLERQMLRFAAEGRAE